MQGAREFFDVCRIYYGAVLDVCWMRAWVLMGFMFVRRLPALAPKLSMLRVRKCAIRPAPAHVVKPFIRGEGVHCMREPVDFCRIDGGSVLDVCWMRAWVFIGFMFVRRLPALATKLSMHLVRKCAIRPAPAHVLKPFIRGGGGAGRQGTFRFLPDLWRIMSWSGSFC